jgi:hypothetical protein
MSNDVVINVKVKNDVNFNPIRDSLKGIETAASQAGQALASGLGDAASSTEKLTTGLAGSAAQAGVTEAASTEASGGLNLLGDALLAVAGAIPMVLGGFAALAPALLAAGGAAGAAITGIAGLGIALATLKIGFGGIGAALQAHGKAMGGAGKAASDTAEQEYQAAKRIKDATRAVKDAQQSVVDATKDVVDAKAREKEAAADVNQAREDEIDRIRELDLALRGQKISQAEAAQALVEAKEKAKRANEAGSDWEKAEAKNAVDRAQLQYDETTEKLGDLTKEKQKSDKQGVEGSDQVQAALKRQTDAHQGVLDAQERLTKANEALVRSQENLADAHHKVATAAAGGAAGMDAFGDAMRKLSPNAQKLVYALLDIEKRFDAIKRRVQDRLLAGFDTAVTDLADKWLPHLDDILGNMADHLNHFGKQLMKSLGDSEFIRNIERAGREMGKFIDKISDATGSLIDAFGRLAGHSGPVLQVIGDLIKNIFDKFDAWIKAADNSGALDNFMTMAAQTLQKIFDIGGSVIEVIGQFVAIIFPSSKKAGDSVLDGVQRALDSISKWLKDPKNQKEIKSIADALAAVVGFVVKVAVPAFLALLRAIEWWAQQSVKNIQFVWGNLWKGAKAAFDWVVSHGSSFFNWMSRAGDTVNRNLSGMWSGLKSGFRDAVNWIIGRWNNLSFTIGGGSFLGMTLPSATLGTPNIPYLASGGTSASGWAVAGEHGRELIRMPQGSTVIPHGTSEQMLTGGGGGGHITLGFDFNSGNRLMDAINEGIRNYVKTRGGGNVQLAYGRRQG